jgi:hypothetical protein
VIADGAYDGAPTYQAVAQHGDGIEVVFRRARRRCPVANRVPPRRDCHLAAIRKIGRLGWQTATGYGRRALVETTIGCYKAIIGARLRARDFAAQQTEAAIGVAVLNRMLAAARQKSVRRERASA